MSVCCLCLSRLKLEIGRSMCLVSFMSVLLYHILRLHPSNSLLSCSNLDFTRGAMSQTRQIKTFTTALFKAAKNRGQVGAKFVIVTSPCLVGYAGGSMRRGVPQN